MTTEAIHDKAMPDEADERDTEAEREAQHDNSVEISWFAALCDDDYRYLGVADPELASSWAHCRDITLTAEQNGFDNILLPSGYTLGIDATAFAAAVAPLTERLRLLLAVRMGELWLPQLARQLATIDRILQGRLTVNIISSDMPGEILESAPRYRRTLEWMKVLRMLLDGESIDFHGEFVKLNLDPPRARTVSGKCPLFYFGPRSGCNAKRSYVKKATTTATSNPTSGPVSAELARVPVPQSSAILMRWRPSLTHIAVSG